MVYFCTNGEMLKRVKNVKSVAVFLLIKCGKFVICEKNCCGNIFLFPQYALGKKELGFVNNMEIPEKQCEFLYSSRFIGFY